MLIVLVLGLVFGSFVNALVWRMHEQLTNKSKRFKPELSIVKGRSLCPSCKHQLSANDLWPVISWIALRGKCRYCKKPISWQYPLVELSTAALFMLSYAVWPFSFSLLGYMTFVVWLIILVQLVALFVYDIKWMILPNRLVGLVVPFSGLLVVLHAFDVRSPGYVLSAVTGAAVIAGLFWALFQISGGKWIGGGDVKLAVALGLIAGSPVKALLVIFIASLLGTVISLPFLIAKKRKLINKVAFGPYLITATVIVFFWGSAMIHWYAEYVLMFN